MRAVLGQLRGEADEASVASSDAPAGSGALGLSRLPELRAAVTAAGSPVTVTIKGAIEDTIKGTIEGAIEGGVTATSLITADPALPGVRVVALTTFDDDESVFAALRAGASGFLVKDVEPEDLLRAIRVIAAGEALLSPAVTRAVIAHFTSSAATSRNATATARQGGAVAASLSSLTEREREVVSLVARGLSNDEIAARLTVSPLTAKTHVSRAMTKLGARDRAQLVVLAYENGLAPHPG
jgi:DNA-binding NarL/FixJ family response regulator